MYRTYIELNFVEQFEDFKLVFLFDPQATKSHHNTVVRLDLLSLDPLFLLPHS